MMRRDGFQVALSALAANWLRILKGYLKAVFPIS